MDYSRIVAVTGLPGLFEVVASKTDGAIVRSLDDKTTRFLSSRIHNLSHLESIEIYTVNENVNLVEVFNAMKANKTALPDTKDNDAIRKYFEKVYPDMDFERVYASDMKKMVKWFEVLNSNKVEIKLSEPEEEDNTEETVKDAAKETTTTLEVSGLDTAETAKPKRTKKKTEEEEEEVEEKAPAKKAAPKKAAAKSASKSADSKAAPSKTAKSKGAKK